MSELIVGPFFRPEIYPRAARLPPLRSFVLLLLVTLLCGLVLALQWYGTRRLALDELRDSPLRELPALTVQGSEIRTADPGPRAFDAGPFVLWLETETNRPTDFEIKAQLSPGESRPIVHIGRDALVVYRPGEAPKPLAWSQLTAREGTVSVDGSTVVDWLASQLHRRTWDGLVMAVPALGFYQLVFIILLSLLYRVLFFRGPDVPRVRALASAGAVAGLPPLVVVTLLGLCGLATGMIFVVHALLLGLNFLFMASRLRAGLGEAPPNPEAPRPRDLLMGMGPADLDKMLDQGLVSAEDYAVARRLLGEEESEVEQEPSSE